MSGKDDQGEDPDLFRRAVEDARPLKQDTVLPHRRPRKPVPEQKLRDEKAVLDDLLAHEARHWEVETGEELLYQGPGIRNSTWRDLRRGRFAIEAELDLHRLTVTESQQRLDRFLREARDRGCRCVRIIHGKGLGSAGRVPVLKGKVNAWLRRRAEVLAFCSAQPRDGGTGAVYVLLKRK